MKNFELFLYKEQGKNEVQVLSRELINDNLVSNRFLHKLDVLDENLDKNVKSIIDHHVDELYSYLSKKRNFK